MGRSATAPSWDEVLDWLARAPAGTQVDARALHELLEEAGAWPEGAPEAQAAVAIEPTWCERLWTAPAESRIGVREVAEALGRPRSWVYRRTGPNASKARIPHRKLDGELVFVVGEVRDWIKNHEVTVASPMPQ